MFRAGSYLVRTHRIIATSSRAMMSSMPNAIKTSFDPAALSPSCGKLLQALEEYRSKNYGQTLFTRYIRDVIHAMDTNQDGMVSYNELTSLLHNIGADSKVTNEDVLAIMNELGEGVDHKQIAADFVEELILGTYNHNVEKE